MAFVVLEISHSLVFMSNLSNANNCWCKKNPKTVQHDLKFIFDHHSESDVIFVLNLIFLAVKNLAIFIENEFSRKRGCLTMRNYAERFCLYKGYKIAPNVLTQRSSCNNYVFETPTPRVNSAKMRHSHPQVSLRKWMSALSPSRWCQQNWGSECFRKVTIYIYIYIYMTYLSHDVIIKT